MSAYQMPRRAINAGDPPEVFEVEAQLLAAYSQRIESVVEDILAKFSDPDARKVAATAFIAKIGTNMPDDTILAAIKRLATVSPFRRPLPSAGGSKCFLNSSFAGRFLRRSARSSLFSRGRSRFRRCPLIAAPPRDIQPRANARGRRSAGQPEFVEKTGHQKPRVRALQQGRELIKASSRSHAMWNRRE